MFNSSSIVALAGNYLLRETKMNINHAYFIGFYLQMDS